MSRDYKTAILNGLNATGAEQLSGADLEQLRLAKKAGDGTAAVSASGAKTVSAANCAKTGADLMKNVTNA